jgi:hypothetical protein
MATMTCPIGVTFDGTNDYMRRGSALSGAVDSSKILCSFWVKKGADGTAQQIFQDDTTASVEIQWTAGNLLRVWLYTPSFGDGFSFQSSAYTTASGWLHILFSADTNFAAGARLGSLYVNDVSDFAVVAGQDYGIAFNCPFGAGSTDWSVGANSGNIQRLNADIGDLWIGFGQYSDLSVTANRRRFVSADGKSVNLGATGELPTGTSPTCFLRGPAAAFPTNLGTGGNFTVTGALTDSVTNPPCSAAGAGSEQLGRKRPRAILMPDGRVIRPHTREEYDRLARQAINAIIQKTEIPSGKGRTAQKIRKALAKAPLAVPLETIEAMQPNPYELDISAAIQTMLAAMRQADDDALFIILAALS